MTVHTIALDRPVGSERVRDFQPPWRTEFLYDCPAGHRVRMRAGCFRGKTPVPGIGAITCPQCEFLEKYPQ